MLKVLPEELHSFSLMVENLVNVVVDERINNLLKLNPGLDSFDHITEDESDVERSETEMKIVNINADEIDLKISIKDKIFKIDFGEGKVISGNPSNLTIRFLSKPASLSNLPKKEESEVIDIVVEDSNESSGTDVNPKPEHSSIEDESGILLEVGTPEKQNGFLGTSESEDSLEMKDRMKRHIYRRYRPLQYRITRRLFLRRRPYIFPRRLFTTGYYRYY